MRVFCVSVLGSRTFGRSLCAIRMIGLRGISSEVGYGRKTLSKVVILEGNIGVGKTTLACTLGRELNYRVMLEPTAKNPYLAKFYKDPKNYALKLQLWIFRQRFMMYVEALKHLIETGNFFSRFCIWSW